MNQNDGVLFGLFLASLFILVFISITKSNYAETIKNKLALELCKIQNNAYCEQLNKKVKNK